MQVSTTILSALRCRELGPSVTVLEANYGISCDSDEYAPYKITACVLLVVWVVGIPLGMLTVLLRQWRESKRQWEAKRLGSDHSHRSFGILPIAFVVLTFGESMGNNDFGFF